MLRRSKLFWITISSFLIFTSLIMKEKMSNQIWFVYWRTSILGKKINLEEASRQWLKLKINTGSSLIKTTIWMKGKGRNRLRTPCFHRFTLNGNKSRMELLLFNSQRWSIDPWEARSKGTKVCLSSLLTSIRSMCPLSKRRRRKALFKSSISIMIPQRMISKIFRITTKLGLRGPLKKLEMIANLQI